ncbi:MAG TPA: SAM-dependent methyltransferase, partial [Anaerolineae bacterium]|nr:SAM-dependent methyltransferase [Anaerolineae bacterium]
MTNDDLLQRQLKSIPAFRAVLRAVEARFYYSIDLPRPILDVGCGDGHFSQMIFQEPVDVGIDPWWNPLQKSRHSGMYRVLAQAMGDKMPLPSHTFGSAFSNSVLEHIPDIQPVLEDVSRVLQPGAPFVMTMPSQYFTEWLGGAAAFERLGLSGMADQYRRFFNGISRHAHTEPPEVWAEWLANAGFAVERWQY